MNLLNNEKHRAIKSRICSKSVLCDNEIINKFSKILKKFNFAKKPLQFKFLRL